MKNKHRISLSLLWQEINTLDFGIRQNQEKKCVVQFSSAAMTDTPDKGLSHKENPLRKSQTP